jgi:hypothetical protein
MNNVLQQQKKGAAMMIFIVIFLVASIALTYSLTYALFSDIQASRLSIDSKQSYLTADSGVEDLAYRYIAGLNHGTTEVVRLQGTVATTTSTYNGATGSYLIASEAIDTRAYRATALSLFVGDGASFNFGMQAGNGGIFMENSSSVLGNVFANGTIEGANTNIVYGDIISAGPTGLAKNVHATGSVWAHRIESSYIEKNAYFTTESSNVVNGTKFFPVPDQATATMPISDAQIDDWKADAQAGGIITSTDPRCSGGTYDIDVDTTIGPVKIECNLLVDKTSTDLYLQGPVWVVGNIDTKSSPNIHVDASATGKSIAMIADNPSNRTTSSKIMLENSVTFNGAGTNSFILLISQNNSAELGGGETAINIKNSAMGDILLYASHGKILIENSANLKEVTAYKIHLKNSAQVIYESGLVNLLFTSGPGGGFTLGSWLETL